MRTRGVTRPGAFEAISESAKESLLQSWNSNFDNNILTRTTRSEGKA